MDRITALAVLSCCLFLTVQCRQQPDPGPETTSAKKDNGIRLVILGTAQDAGVPQMGCTKSCCSGKWQDISEHQKVVSLGIIDDKNQKTYLFEATPDIGEQLQALQQEADATGALPHGIFLTHAHIGHYSGLMYLGKEAMNSKAVKVYTMSRMQAFLSENGPWDQLVKNQNIELAAIRPGKEIVLSEHLSVQPLLVPHRDEYSETVGFMIKGPARSALFIPDIDKWSRWEKDITELVKKVDLAFLDATFYDGSELPSRSMDEIPHPFVVESTALFRELETAHRKKIHFIHFNHTNPLLSAGSKASREIKTANFNISREGMQFEL